MWGIHANPGLPGATDRPDYFFCNYLEKGNLEQVILLGGHVVYIYASFG